MASVLRVSRAGLPLLNVCLLLYIQQIPIRIRPAHAPGYMTVLRQCIPQDIADHTVTVFIVVHMGCEIPVQTFKRLAPIMIIRIDRSKGAIDHILTTQDRMPCPKRLDPTLRRLPALRQGSKLLVHIRDIHVAADPISDRLPERLLIFLLDDKNDLTKTCLLRIID